MLRQCYVLDEVSTEELIKKPSQSLAQLVSIALEGRGHEIRYSYFALERRIAIVGEV